MNQIETIKNRNIIQTEEETENGSSGETRIFITGDTHGEFKRIANFCWKNKTTKSDILVILGDAGINYFGDGRDEAKKLYLETLPLTFFCIHGNHEMRPQTIEGYKEHVFHGGVVWREDKYPHILFARDGEVFDFSGRKCLVIGGAYSVDKYYRLTHHYRWFEDEQPDDGIKRSVERKLGDMQYKTDIILTHTCPKKYEPIEAFMKGVIQATVDKSTEIWLDEIEESVTYDKWYCGHWHISKRTDRIVFMFEDYDMI